MYHIFFRTRPNDTKRFRRSHRCQTCFPGIVVSVSAPAAQLHQRGVNDVFNHPSVPKLPTTARESPVFSGKSQSHFCRPGDSESHLTTIRLLHHAGITGISPSQSPRYSFDATRAANPGPMLLRMKHRTRGVECGPILRRNHGKIAWGHLSRWCCYTHNCRRSSRTS